MRTLTKALAAVGAVALLATPAAALTVTNDDDVAYKIAVVVGDQRDEYELAAKGSLDAACEALCVISIIGQDGDDGMTEVNSTDKVMIKDGVFEKVESN